MKETIFLIVSQNKVERMVKNLPVLSRGEIPVKVNVSIEPQAFRTPVIEKDVYVEDWREGIDIADVDFKQTSITKDEAELIKKARLEAMTEVLRNNGYEVTKAQQSE